MREGGRKIDRQADGEEERDGARSAHDATDEDGDDNVLIRHSAD